MSWNQNFTTQVPCSRLRTMESHAARSVPVDDHIKMKDIPKQDRPYEKCILKGPGILSDEELLAVILRTGSKHLSSLQLARKVLEAGFATLVIVILRG